MTLALQHIKHKDIDFGKWDNTILASEVPTVFAQAFFLNATSPGWEALVINDYESVFPLTRKSKFGFNYLPQPHFTSQLGAFGKVSGEREKLFHEYIIKKFKLIEIELNSSNHFLSEYNKPKNTFVIEYDKGYSFNQNTKRNLARAESGNLKVKEVPPDEIIELSEKILDPFLLNTLKLPSYAVGQFRNLLLNSISANAIKTLKVVNEKEETKAIGHFVYNKRYVVFLKGTNIDKADNSGSMHLLIKHGIEFFEDKCECFDFAGGSLNQGLAGFYMGLGGVQLDYSVLRINNLPIFVRFLKK